MHSGGVHFRIPFCMSTCPGIIRNPGTPERGKLTRMGLTVFTYLSGRDSESISKNDSQFPSTVIAW
jgi:hypothetical protein